jgi:hypothetical protein
MENSNELEVVLKFIRETGVKYNSPKEIHFEKTQKGNWAVLKMGTHQGVFIQKEFLSDDTVKKHNKNALKK